MVLDPLDEKRVERIHDKLSLEFAKPIPDSVVKKFMPGVVYRRNGVIHLTKLNGASFMMNSELIETLEETPDTVISMATGRKYLVRESIDEIRNKCIEYKRDIFQDSTKT